MPRLSCKTKSPVYTVEGGKEEELWKQTNSNGDNQLSILQNINMG